MAAGCGIADLPEEVGALVWGELGQQAATPPIASAAAECPHGSKAVFGIEARRFEDGFPMSLDCSRYHQGFWLLHIP
jgi:hypothetical protein